MLLLIIIGAFMVGISTDKALAMMSMFARKRSQSPKEQHKNLVRTAYRKQVMKYHLHQLTQASIDIHPDIQRQILDTIAEKEYEGFTSSDLQTLAEDMHQLTLSQMTNELSMEAFLTALNMVQRERESAHKQRYGLSQVSTTPPASLSSQPVQSQSALTDREIGQLIPILGRVAYSEKLFQDDPLLKEDLSEEEIYVAAVRLFLFMEWYRNEEIGLADRNDLCEGIIGRYRGKYLRNIFRKYLELSTGFSE